MAEHRPESEAELRAIYGEVSGRAARKAIPALDRHCIRFIELSPFLVLGSASPEGPADVSPKGDTPGFVRVLDSRTIAIPDRPGNRRIDSLLNIVANPHVAVIFMIPGIKETLRINGRAHVSTEPGLLDLMIEQGKRPVSAIVVEVDETYLHCAKAFIRSKLWDPEVQVERTVMPPLSKMIADQLGDEIDVDASEKALEKAYRETLY
ncbi:MAG: pyridoxamine 5'-phosphate oxidase family protein [Pseudomonadota bacterium]|nr:pyridoxamine 5'-phosphate oxidase family protein [Pseudomonadota bacterium]